MKTTAISLISLIFISFVMCSTKKDLGESAQTLNQKMENQSIEKLFISDWNGGEEKPGFVILNDSKALNTTLLKLKSNLSQLITEPTSEQQVELPTKEKAVFYSFGMMRSGIYKAKGIENIKLVGEKLQVTMLKEPTSMDDLMQPREAVISTPWMIFSVPKELNFKEIIIK